MKKFTLTIYCLLMLFSCSFAQKPEYLIGDASYKVGLGAFQVYGAGKASNGEYYVSLIHAVLFKKPTLTCLSFDKNLKTTKANEAELTSMIPGKSMVGIQESFTWNDSLYSLLTDLDSKNKTQELFLCTSYQNTMQLSKPRSLAKVKGIEQKPKKFWQIEDYYYFNFKVVFSPDSSKILLNYLYQKDGSGQLAMYMQVWSIGFETLLWEKEYNIPFNRKETGVNKFHIDNQGNVYLLFNTDIAPTLSLKEDYRYEIVRITEFGETITVNTVNLPTTVARDLTLGFDTNGDMLACAYYYENKALQGIAMLRFPLEMEKLPPLQYHNFKQEINATKYKEPAFVEMMSMLAFRGNQDYFYYLNQMIPQKNGDILLVGEIQYLEDDPQSSYKYRYHYDDVIVMRINGEGKILWVQRIPKKHETSDRNASYCSYSCVPMGESLGILYNDNIENDWTDNKRIRQFPNFPSKNVLVIAEVKPDGSAERKVIMQLNEMNFYPLTHYLTVIAPNEGIMGYYKNGVFGIGRLKW